MRPWLILMTGALGALAGGMLAGCFPSYSFDMPETTSGSGGSGGTAHAGTSGASTSSGASGTAGSPSITGGSGGGQPGGVSGSAGTGGGSTGGQAGNSGQAGQAGGPGEGDAGDGSGSDGADGSNGTAGTAGTGGRGSTNGTGGSVTCGAHLVTGVLDDFSNDLGSWTGDVSDFEVQEGTLRPKPGGTLLFQGQYGTGISAYVTVNNMPASGTLALILGADASTCQHVEVALDPGNGAIQIRHCVAGVWVSVGVPVLANFEQGDVLGAHLDPLGLVDIFRNKTCVGGTALPAGVSVPTGGRIGLRATAATGAHLDDFGGGEE